MDRRYYLGLAEAGACIPIAADLVLREKPDHDAILRDGHRLGEVLEEAARRYNSPFALPIMDLTLEKTALLEMLGIPLDQHKTFHFTECPSQEMLEAIEGRLGDPYDARLQANIDAIAWCAGHTGRLPVGMGIGPFSLMTKLLADPITPLYLAGDGVSAEEAPDIAMVQRTLELATRIVLRSIVGQINAGAKAIFIAEPAACAAYLSPNQIDAGSDIFERYVMTYNRQVKSLLESRGVDLFFHCCGELSDSMVRKFVELDPAILSLGSSRSLWEDAKLVSRRVVLYGNLPSKQFYSDVLMPLDEVERMSRDLLNRMRQAGHPFILGTECDVLSVPGCEGRIRDKVSAIVGLKSTKDRETGTLPRFASVHHGTCQSTRCCKAKIG